MRYFFNIGSITQLNDVVDSIQQITLYINVADISQEFVTELHEAAKMSKGKSTINVSLYDSDSKVSVNMHAKKLRVLFDDNIRKVLEKYRVKYTLN